MARTDQKHQFGHVNHQNYAHADAIAAQLVGSAQRDDEQLRAFQRAFTDNVARPGSVTEAYPTDAKRRDWRKLTSMDASGGRSRVPDKGATLRTALRRTQQ